tara:strand:- start:322 stop:939 length:618 start_codon:yes stop_codon:yes gene_type:complete
METNTPTTDNGKWMTNLIVFGALGGIVFFLLKKKVIEKQIDAYQQKTTTKEMNKLFSMVGPTFKKKKFLVGKSANRTTNGADIKYGDEQVADSFTADGVGYHLFFFPWYSYDSGKEYTQIERPFIIKGDDGKKSTGIVFFGTWKIEGDKLVMSFLQYSKYKSWLKVKTAIKKGEASTFSGSIKEILSKATGGKTIVLDGLAARYK